MNVGFTQGSLLFPLSIPHTPLPFPLEVQQYVSAIKYMVEQSSCRYTVGWCTITLDSHDNIYQVDNHSYHHSNSWCWNIETLEAVWLKSGFRTRFMHKMWQLCQNKIVVEYKTNHLVMQQKLLSPLYLKYWCLVLDICMLICRSVH